MNSEINAQPSRREWHGTHHSWDYRPQAFRWVGERIVGINFIPLALDMRAWMTQSGQLSLMSMAAMSGSGGYTNPYTASGASLALLMAQVINASHQYATSPAADDDPVQAEIERLRLYNEALLYAARFCEVAVKQVLYCTQIPERQYRRMALGALLESPCPVCKKQNGKTPHIVSLVGTLAHPFRLCLEFEHCAMDHMNLVNRLRNSQAAHSGSQVINPRTVRESKMHLFKDCDELLSGFLHLLSHFEKLEERMLDDLDEKGSYISTLKMNGLPPEKCNFQLTPGVPFVFAPQSEHP